MELPPGLIAARRLITIVCAVLAVLAIGGAVAYSLGETGDGCGSGWAAARKPLPSPLLTPEEVAQIKREGRNEYEAGIAKAKPVRDCRSAGSSRLIKAGLGALLILVPVGALLAVLHWPRRHEPDEVVDLAEPTTSRR